MLLYEFKGILGMLLISRNIIQESF